MLSFESHERLVPPCMKQLLLFLHTKHHLKHHERMALVLFLKGMLMSTLTVGKQLHPQKWVICERCRSDINTLNLNYSCTFKFFSISLGQHKFPQSLFERSTFKFSLTTRKQSNPDNSTHSKVYIFSLFTYLLYLLKSGEWTELPGIGIPHSDTTTYILREFRKTMSPEQIRHKKYAYNIRHLYGLEGGRIDRAPMQCCTMIDYNLCPYKSSDTKHLHELLSDVTELPAEVLEKLTTSCSAGNYQVL